MLSGAFPFALGSALALLAIWALQSRLHWRCRLLTALCFAASPLAFLLLVVLLVAIGIARAPKRDDLVLPLVTVAVVGAAEAVLWRLFPASGRFPFSVEELATVCASVVGMWLTWNVPAARVLRWIYVIYLPVCIAAFLVPSGVGENIARLRFAALPLAVLTLSLRRWRPFPLAALVFVLAFVWNVTPLAASYAKGASDPAAKAEYWAPAIFFLHHHLDPSYRVEAVDTAGHWPAAYLPAAGIPITRGWFRQEDFPATRCCTTTRSGPLRTCTGCARWRFATSFCRTHPSTTAHGPKHSCSRAAGRAAARFRSVHTTVYAVPSPRKLITGPARANVASFDQSRLTFTVGEPGRYRVAMSWSPYWRVSSGCTERGKDGMTVLDATRAGTITMRFTLGAGSVLATFAGRSVRSCAR